MTFKEFLQREFTSGASVGQMNPATLGARAAKKELGLMMPTRTYRQTGQTSVGRQLNSFLGMRPSLPTPEKGPTLKSNLDRKPKKYFPEVRPKQVKSPLGYLKQQQSSVT